MTFRQIMTTGVIALTLIALCFSPGIYWRQVTGHRGGYDILAKQRAIAISTVGYSIVTGMRDGVLQTTVGIYLSRPPGILVTRRPPTSTEEAVWRKSFGS